MKDYEDLKEHYRQLLNWLSKPSFQNLLEEIRGEKSRMFPDYTPPKCRFCGADLIEESDPACCTFLDYQCGTRLRACAGWDDWTVEKRCLDKED